MYMETQDLSGIGKVFTSNKNWKALSVPGVDYLPYLEKKQAVLGVINLTKSEAGTALQIKPELVMAVDTELSDSEATTVSQKVTRELASIFLKEEGDLQLEGARSVFTSSSGKKLFSAAVGTVVLVSNSEEALTKCLGVKQNKLASLSDNPELAGAMERHGAKDNLTFGYVSEKGIEEAANYLGISYAVKSSDDSFMREIVSGTMPGFLQKTVRSVSWSARVTDAGVEDTYLFKTEKQFTENVYQAIKPSSSNVAGQAERYLPGSIFSATRYRLENPQIAWRGMVLSLAAQLDERSLGLFEQFSEQLLKPYGIDQPEVFLSAVDSPIVTARFDEAGNEAVVIAKIKDKEKIKSAIAETFDIALVPQTIDHGEVLKSRDGEFSAAFVGDTLVLGNSLAVEKCLKASTRSGGSNVTAPSGFAGDAAIVSSRQKDDSAVQILSYVAAKAAGQSQTQVQIDSYAFSEIAIEQNGVRRRTLSAFGLLGEMFKQTFE